MCTGRCHEFRCVNTILVTGGDVPASPDVTRAYVTNKDTISVIAIGTP